MTYGRIYLKENAPDVFLEAFIAEPLGSKKRKAILVIPGGGYASVCADREGEPIAMAFMPYGYKANNFVNSTFTTCQKSSEITAKRFIAPMMAHISAAVIVDLHCLPISKSICTIMKMAA